MFFMPPPSTDRTVHRRRYNYECTIAPRTTADINSKQESQLSLGWSRPYWLSLTFKVI